MIADEESARAFCSSVVDAAGMERLERFVQLLAGENQRQNLVSDASMAKVWQRHIADSLQLLSYVPANSSPWLDLGSGAGPPGLVIALARADLPVHLVESRRRRAQWLVQVVEECGLSQCRVHDARLEDVDTIAAGVVSARAFAPLAKLMRLSARFSTPNTYWLLPKGRSAAQELADQASGLRALFHVEQSLTDPEAGLLIGQGRPNI